MEKLFAELKRRHILRIAAAYLVAMWFLIQLVNNVAPPMRLPEWTSSFVLVLLLVGFPVALIFAWCQDLKAHTPAEGPAQRAFSTRVDFGLAAALGVVGILILYQQFAPVSRAPQASEAAAARLAAASPATAVAVAVLPFANVSADPNQEFFSDGMTDEISSALAKIPDLRVVARTSAFRFKGQNADIAEIGRALNATHLVEGTVRRAGDRLRITVQLVQAADGIEIWSENYDRNLTDVFSIQEEIARAVVASLGMQLGLAAGERVVSNRIGDLEAYQEYLRTKALFRSRGEGVPEAVAGLEALLSRSPDYAPAWALLANAYFVTPATRVQISWPGREESARLYREYAPKVEAAAREALRLDPLQTSAHAVMAAMQMRHRNWIAADDLFQKALALDANDPESLNLYRRFLAMTGRLQDASQISAHLRTIEPFVPQFNAEAAMIELAQGRSEAGRTLKDQPRGIIAFALSSAAIGQYAEAASAVESLAAEAPQPARERVRIAAELLRRAPAKAPEPLPDFDGDPLSFIYPYVGAPERVIEWPEGQLEIGSLDNAYDGYSLWGPISAAARKGERFKALLRQTGLIAYWRERGWPDRCSPVGADDFVCD